MTQVDITIRSARPADAAAIAAVHDEAWRGRNRLAASPYLGEIFELYLAPEYQGLGFGRRLFTAARRDLDARALKGLLVWALADNDRACGFYTRLGGIKVREMDEAFGTVVRTRHAFGWV